MSTTDAELIQRWARGQDAEAFRELVNRHAGMVFSTSRRILGHTADAEDLTQECFLKLCQLRRPAHNVAAWLHRVVTRGAIDMLRARARRREVETRWEAPEVATHEVTWHDIEPFVDEAIEALPEGVRAPLVLYYLRNQTQEAVAEALGIHQATVSHRVRKGIETIRRQLQRRGLSSAPAVLSGWLSTRTAEATPASLLARLGKVAILGHDADRPRRSKAFSETEATTTSVMGGWPMKITVASITGFVVVGTFALFVFTSPSAPEPVPRDLANAPTAIPNTEPVAETPLAPPEPPRGDEKTPPPPVTKPAIVGGTIRNEKEEPVALADVYLAMNLPPDDDLASLFFRADYFQRSRFLETRTDEKGRYLFERVRDFGYGTLGAFKEGHSGPRGVGSTARKSVKIDEGAVRTDIDLVIAEGKTLIGRVLARDGTPVADAIVSVTTAWSPTSHIFWPAGLGPTDAGGRFRLGLEAKATACHLRVNSDSYGQDFFAQVPVTDEEVELTLNEFARVEGTITWTDRTPASGLTVRVHGRLPEPPIPVSRMGERAEVVHEGLVGADGTYIIEGLHPQLRYYIFLIDSSLGEREARRRTLTPRMMNSFRVDAGGVKVWDHTVPRPTLLTVRGHIRTEASGRLLPRARVGVRKDGKTLTRLSVEADSEGSFELRLNAGPGDYLVFAEPPGDFPAPREIADLIIDRFGKTLHLVTNEEVEVDLTIFEATVLPIRVLDATGEPVKSVHTEFHVTFPNGKKMALGRPCSLDETGRTTFSIHYPAREFWYEIGAFPHGPPVETRRYAADPGTVLPEETLVLPRTCDLVATLVDSSGEACAERGVSVRIVYEDGKKERFSCRTDERGALDEKGRLRAAPLALELRVESKVVWKSPRLDGSAGEALDLGQIVLE